MTKKKTDDCECVKQVNEKLNADGVELESSMALNFKTGKAKMVAPLISVKWKDKPKRGKRLPVCLCSYCPFCGKKVGG